MPPYSNAAALVPNDDAVVHDVEEKPITDNTDEVTQPSENTSVEPNVDLSAAPPTIRTRSLGTSRLQPVEFEGSGMPSQTQRARGARPRRSRVQSMPEGSEGAANFFGAPAAVPTKLDGIVESVRIQDSSSGFPSVKSKSTDALSKLGDSLIEGFEETAPSAIEKVECAPKPKPEAVVKTEDAQNSTPSSDPASQARDVPAKSAAMKETATCQCIIL